MFGTLESGVNSLESIGIGRRMLVLQANGLIDMKYSTALKKGNAMPHVAAISAIDIGTRVSEDMNVDQVNARTGSQDAHMCSGSTVTDLKSDGGLFYVSCAFGSGARLAQNPNLVSI